MCTGALRRYDRCVCKYIRIFIKLLKNALIRVGVQVWSTLLSRRRLVRPREVVSERERERGRRSKMEVKKNCGENKIIAGETT